MKPGNDLAVAYPSASPPYAGWNRQKPKTKASRALIGSRYWVTFP
jgi:hypothetical protein